jgi:hypothetical protein
MRAIGCLLCPVQSIAVILLISLPLAFAIPPSAEKGKFRCEGNLAGLENFSI